MNHYSLEEILETGPCYPYEEITMWMSEYETVTAREIRKFNKITNEDKDWILRELRNLRRRKKPYAPKCPLEYAARKKMGDKSNRPVKTVPGSNEPPRWEGEGWHYQTNGGSRIHYPSAYSKKGWSNMNYISSTLHIVVGEHWKDADK